MPVTVSYPGVYIEEIPSGVRTITGVATSIAAFVGRARSGPVNEPVVINSFGDFERRFGGLAVDFPLSYAVRDFFLNGGGQAIVVRLFKPVGTKGAAALSAGGLSLRAVSEGTWGEALRATVSLVGPAADQVFNLTVRDTRLGGLSEDFRNLTIKDGPRRVDLVLAAESQLVRWAGTWPPASQVVVEAGDDAVTQKETLIPPLEKAVKIAKSALQGLRDQGKGDSDPLVIAALATLKTANDALVEGNKNLRSAIDGLNAGDSDALGSTELIGQEDKKTGLFALAKTDLFNLLCVPPDKRSGDTPPDVYQAALDFCVRRRALLLVDPPAAWGKAKDEAVSKAISGLDSLSLTGPSARNAALYFPRVLESDLLNEGRLDTFVPCGAVAGVMARTDVQRGVWKAPAGVDAALNGVQGLEVNLNDLENGQLNQLGINCLRTFPGGIGRVVFGARTLRGSDQLADEYKYVPVRRTALFIEESLFRGTKWVVFEPNDEPLWAQIRLNVGAFMQNLFRQGAFQGQTPRDAYLVKCDKETTTQNDINLGIVNIVVGFAPLKPAEFVIIKIQQLAGQIAT